jgi:hypothetical protein
MFAAREVSDLLPVGTIVLVYDKVSFVSAKVVGQESETQKTPPSQNGARCNEIFLKHPESCLLNQNHGGY